MPQREQASDAPLLTPLFSSKTLSSVVDTFSYYFKFKKTDSDDREQENMHVTQESFQVSMDFAL